MLILGIVCGIDLQYERIYHNLPVATHDSAAVLIEDGKVVYGIEEERLNRLKHSDKAPVSAIRFCLDSSGIKPAEIDKIGVFATEQFCNNMFNYSYLVDPKSKTHYDIRTAFHRFFKTAYGSGIDDAKLFFIHHHLAHAASGFYMSGFDQSLVLTVDGMGDNDSGMVLDMNQSGSTILKKFSIPNSLGHYYIRVIQFLGYGLHDEYKVMGLAPYGDDRKYQDLFQRFYTLLPEGDYLIHSDIVFLLHEITKPRKKGEPFTQVHKDIAASLQKSLEEIILHILGYYQGLTKHHNLCMAGGVAHNCSVNGKIMYSGLFDRIFVQPAAHDAGCALGAALYLYHQDHPAAPRCRLEHVFWGTEVGKKETVLRTLRKWQDFLDYEMVDRLSERAADLLAKGAVIGWIQGRSEFGPRTLGNRSIVADPARRKIRILSTKWSKNASPTGHLPRPFSRNTWRNITKLRYKINNIPL